MAAPQVEVVMEAPQEEEEDMVVVHQVDHQVDMEVPQEVYLI